MCRSATVKMKISDILSESIVPHDYTLGYDAEIDKRFNYEAYRIAELNDRYYVENFKDGVPVFVKPDPEPEDKNFNTAPKGMPESAGRKGRNAVMSLIRHSRSCSL